MRQRPIRAGLCGLAAALLLGGCGGDGGGGETGGGANGGAGTADTRSASYDAASQLCAPGVKAVAADYAVDATAEAVIQVVVEQVAGGSVQDEQSAREGCRDALEKAGG